MDAVLYIHGRDGAASEAERFRPLFPDCDVFGLDYRGKTPWDAGKEIRSAVAVLTLRYEAVTLIANSIGAFFCLHAAPGPSVKKAYFISPVVDMEAMITGLMAAENVTEAELQARGTVPTAFGEDLSWDYLQYVRTHPIRWNVPTAILAGENDALVPAAQTERFAAAVNAALTVMEGGEHWFHTEEQLRFLDNWILREQQN